MSTCQILCEVSDKFVDICMALIGQEYVLKIYCLTYGGIFLTSLSDNYVVLSDLYVADHYVDLSEHYVDLSDHYVDL